MRDSRLMETIEPPTRPKFFYLLPATIQFSISRFTSLQHVQTQLFVAIRLGEETHGWKRRIVVWNGDNFRKLGFFLLL